MKNRTRRHKRVNGQDKAEIFNIEGQIPCVVMFPDRKHVDYIYNLLNPIEKLLSKRGFRVYFLSEHTNPDEHFGKKFEELADECVLGVAIFDGFRPNVLYEYGYLRGKGRLLIPLRDKKACVSIKSFYKMPPDCTNEVIQSETGLTKRQFINLKNPSIGHFSHLSDRHGINIIEVDCGARANSPVCPEKKVESELEKLMPAIIKEQTQRSVGVLEETTEISPSYLSEAYSLILEMSNYYTQVENYDHKDLENLMENLQTLENESKQRMPPNAYMMIGELYNRLVGQTGRLEVSKRIQLFEKALNVYNRLDGMQLENRLQGELYNRIGVVYSKISQYHMRGRNCELAIEAFKGALKVWTLKDSPIDYAGTQNNLGVAYGILAEVKERQRNCELAVEAFKGASEVWTLKDFPIDHATALNNLGNAYSTLARVKEPERNCELAVEALKVALKVRTLKDSPIDHATTQTSLGNAYRRLAEVKDPERNCELAVEAFKVAMKVLKRENLKQSARMVGKSLAECVEFSGNR